MGCYECISSSGNLFLAQAYVEEAQEYQVGIDDSRYRRRTSAGPRIKAEEIPREQSPSADAIQRMIQVYCRCLQHALQVLIQYCIIYTLHLSVFICSILHVGYSITESEAIHVQDTVTVLQTQCGLGASLASLTRRMWLGHVASSGVLTTAFATYSQLPPAFSLVES